MKIMQAVRFFYPLRELCALNGGCYWRLVPARARRPLGIGSDAPLPNGPSHYTCSRDVLSVRMRGVEAVDLLGGLD